MVPSSNDAQQVEAVCNFAPSPPLSPVRETAALLVAQGHTDEEVADAVGVNRVSVWRWRRGSPVFQAAVNKHRVEINENINDRYRRMVLRAVDVAGILLDSEDELIRLKAVALLLTKSSLSLTAGPTSAEKIVIGTAMRKFAQNTDPDSEKRLDEFIDEAISEAEQEASGINC